MFGFIVGTIFGYSVGCFVYADKIKKLNKKFKEIKRRGVMMFQDEERTYLNVERVLDTLCDCSIQPIEIDGCK